MDGFSQIVGLVRDFVIIIVGVIWIVAGLIAVILAWTTWRFVKSMPRRTEAVSGPAQELLGQARQAVGTAGEGARTAREAIVFVSDKAVMPTIMAASAVVGVQKFVQTLLRGGGQREDMT